MEELKKQHPWLTDSELVAYAELPKKEDGKTFDLESMDAEQRALYYKDRAEAQASGFNKYKDVTDKEVTKLKQDLEAKGKVEQPKGKTLTEEELEDLVPGYEGLSQSEKNLITQTIAPFAKNVTALQNQVSKLLDQDRFKEELRSLLADPKYKVLVKHKEAFKVFAYQDENLNTPLKTLANSYIYENELKEEDEPTDDDKRKGLEGGGGGSGNLPPKTGMTSTELLKLRTTDPRRYNRLARDKKLSKTAGLD